MDKRSFSEIQFLRVRAKEKGKKNKAKEKQDEGKFFRDSGFGKQEHGVF